MNYSHRLPSILGLAFAVLVNGNCAEPSGEDPFADPTDPSTITSEKDIVLKGGALISAHKQWDLPEDRWPEMDPPTIFNRHFEKPSKVWEVDAGYFATFDAGEFGAGLFYSAGTGHKWIRVLDAHVQDLRYFSGNSVLAVGGIAHLTYSRGAAYLIQRRSTGDWMRSTFGQKGAAPQVALDRCLVDL